MDRVALLELPYAISATPDPDAGMLLSTTIGAPNIVSGSPGADGCWMSHGPSLPPVARYDRR